MRLHVVFLLLTAALSCTTATAKRPTSQLVNSQRNFRPHPPTLKKVSPPKTVGVPTPKNKADVLVDEDHHHVEEMSATTAIANVLADLCPHGMLPIGTYAAALLAV
jgi:acyl dehydratase